MNENIQRVNEVHSGGVLGSHDDENLPFHIQQTIVHFTQLYGVSRSHEKQSISQGKRTHKER